MPHDFARQRAARAARSNRPAHAPWLWLLTGIVIGTLVSFLVYLATLAPPPVPEPRKPETAAREDTPATKEAGKKPPEAPATRPQFDFYDLLRHTEGGTATAPGNAAPGAPARPVEVPEPAAKPSVAAPSGPVATPPGGTPAAPAATPAPGTATAAVPPAVQPDAAPAATPPPEAPKPARLAMQAGAFTQRADADRRRGEILLLGYDARIEAVTLPDGQTRYRVSVGPFADAQALANARRALRDVGIDTL